MYKCEKCGKEFKSKMALCGHKAYCGQEKIECPICHKKMQKFNLKRHMRMHDEHKCLFCGKSISKRKKFCDSSCAASYNNPRKKKKNKSSAICINCGKQFIPLKSSVGKFCSSKCSAEYKFKKNDEKYFAGEINNMRTLKAHFLAHNHNKCAICGLSKWQGKDIVMILDHIDGNPENNMPSNLRLVCPNCDSQLSTYKGRNIGNGRFSRRQRYRDGKSY